MITLIIGLIALAGIIIYSTVYSYNELLVITNTILVVLFLIVGSIHLVTYLETTTIPDERVALQETYDNARELSEFERATITKDVAEFNRELAIAKYWNNTVLLDWWYPDSIENVRPIK